MERVIPGGRGMKAARYPLTLLVAGLLFVSSARSMPATIWGIGTSNSVVVVQNTSATDTVNVHAQFINSSGGTDHREPASIPPYGSHQFDVAHTSLSRNWVGSMILSSDQPLVALNNLIWKGGTEGDGTSAGTYAAFAEGSTIVYLPFLSKGKGGYATFAIQNVDRGLTKIKIEYIDRNGTVRKTKWDKIPEGAQRIYDLRSPGGAVPRLGNSWQGAVVVTSSKNLVGVATVHWERCSGAYNGFASGAIKVYIPSVYRRQQNKRWKVSSDIIVQNLSDSQQARVRLYFYDQYGSLKLNFVRTIPTNSSHVYSTKTGGNVPATIFNPLGTSYMGPVVIESNQPIVAVAVTRWWGKQLAGIYNSQATGSTELFLPDVARTKRGSLWDRSTTMAVQNPDPSNDANVRLWFYDRDGTVKLRFNDKIPASSSHEYNTRNRFRRLGNDFMGSVYITSDRPVIGVVNSHWKREGMASQYNIFPGD